MVEILVECGADVNAVNSVSWLAYNHMMFIHLQQLAIAIAIFVGRARESSTCSIILL